MTHLGTAEVTELELVVLCVDQQVLRLDVSMTDAILVYMTQRAAHLIGVQLDKDGRHALIVLGVGFADSVDCVRYELQHEMQVRLILLCG